MINSNTIFLQQQIVTQKEMFDFLSDKVVNLGFAIDVEEVKKALLFRESESSTGMMDGFAIPHAKSSSVLEPTVLIVKNELPIEWNALDGKPITVVFALFIPEEQAGDIHLQLLSKISRLLMKSEIKEAIKECNDPEKLTILLKEGLE